MDWEKHDKVCRPKMLDHTTYTFTLFFQRNLLSQCAIQMQPKVSTLSFEVYMKPLKTVRVCTTEKTVIDSTLSSYSLSL